MKSCARLIASAFFLLAIWTPAARSGDDIPKAAWKRPIGQPLENPGTKKTSLDGGHIDDGFWQGAPVGGFGAGTFSRTYRGDFARWHVKGGVHKYQTVYSNQFAMFQQVEGSASGTAKVLFTDHPHGWQLNGWDWNYPVGAGDYYSLYPKSWFDYRWEKFPAHVTLEQFSPILPDNYKETSYPVAVYRWHAENPTDKTVTVSVLFSWTNMLGWFRTFSRDFQGGLSAGNHNRVATETLGGNSSMKGIVFERSRAGAEPDEWDGQFAIAAMESPGVEVSYHSTFEADGDGKKVWVPFAKDGGLANDDQNWISTGERLAGAIAVRFTLKPGEKRIVPMVLTWDLPVVQFGSGRKWLRKYTEFYGASGKSAWTMARDALKNANAWSDAIDAWQAPYVNDETKPLWYRGMLFNELYEIADGGSLWARPAGAAKTTPATFGFMECFDYPYYATLDVRFYASMALMKFWPEIDKQVLRQFADTVPKELPDKEIWVWKSMQEQKTVLKVRKKKGAVPHDLGAPEEDPFVGFNQFGWQDINGWKDLNTKFVLMVWRDYALTGKKDATFLRYTWPAVKEALDYLKQFDHGGGIPENDGYPDQTYDTWLVRGVSAYSGGLWLAALRAAEEMGKALGESETAERYHQMFGKAQKTYIEKLWNGEYFSYDTESEYKDLIQSDQLAGQWYANATGLGEIVPKEMTRKALAKIFATNVKKFGGGEMGAVNGIAADGSIIKTNEQVQEVWTGTTFGLAALMMGEGMKEEAYETARGIYRVTYETKGYWFRTPEAWDITGNYRASMYMRPTAIWAMEMAQPSASVATAKAKTTARSDAAKP